MQKAGLKIQHFTDLIAWQRAHQLALDIYKESQGFPIEERYGLMSQIRRSTTSIKANIAEGPGRQSKAEKIQFYIIARGSNTELQDHLLTARDLKFMSDISYANLTEQAITVNKLINGLIKSLRGA
jgi:four helix bundle protein